MTLQGSSEDDVQMMLNVLLDDDEENLESSGENHLSQKRKASDSLNEDISKQRAEDLKKRRRKNKHKGRRSRKHSQGQSEKEMILRPNYFVGIQVSNPEIHRMVRIVQEVVLSKEPGLRTALISIPTLHITLAVAHLSDVDQVTRAAEMLDNCGLRHSNFFNKSTPLHFSGLNTFADKVLFAGIRQSETLEQVQMLANDLEASFEKLTGSPTKKGFKPHLTILKLSKDIKLKRQGISKISSALYSEMCDMEFGTQVIQGLQLLSMKKPKDDNGYYFCSHQVAFDVIQSESDDHSECCKKPLSVKPKLENVSKLEAAVKHEKDMVKRRFHSLCFDSLSSVFCAGNESEVTANDSNSVLKKVLVVSAAAVAITSIVKATSSRT